MIPLLAVSLLTAGCNINSTTGYTKMGTNQSLKIYLPDSTVTYSTYMNYVNKEYYYWCRDDDVFVKTFNYRTVTDELELWSIDSNEYYNVTYSFSEQWQEE